MTITRLLAVFVLLAAGPAAARDQIRIVGAATVFPYAAAVGGQTALPPMLEPAATTEAFRRFCAGTGDDQPDIVAAPRRIEPDELKACVQAGVTSVTEIPVGTDGLVLARSRTGRVRGLSKVEIFGALGAKVIVDGQLMDNPNTLWSDVSLRLPDLPIRVYGPPAGSGNHDAFVDRVLREGCESHPAMAALTDEERRPVCTVLRRDSAYVEAGEDERAIVRRLEAEPDALGIVGSASLDGAEESLAALRIDGESPKSDALAEGRYDLARTIVFYVKNAHRATVPALDGFIAALVSEATIGPDGLLSRAGLAPLPAAEREVVRANALGAVPLATRRR